MNYRAASTKKLIEAYADEALRISTVDAVVTRSNIKRELSRRFAAVIEMLDDPQTTENPEGTLRYLLGE